MAGSLLVTVITFVWMVELICYVKDDIQLTNGFFDYDPMQTYHLSMYFMFISTCLNFIYVVWTFFNQ